MDVCLLCQLSIGAGGLKRRYTYGGGGTGSGHRSAERPGKSSSSHGGYK